MKTFGLEKKQKNKSKSLSKTTNYNLRPQINQEFWSFIYIY
jgi:hypothetical protein